MKLLLHTCCGPCFLGVWEDLGPKGFDVTNYFYNPNIYPEDEFARRLDGLKTAAEGKTEGVIVADYQSVDYVVAVTGHENDFPERCAYCYALRLEATAKYAKEHGYDAFSTTLLVSPYQQNDELRRIGADIAKRYGLEFYYTDWRPYFRKGQDEAKFIPIYRQNYCGCKHSLALNK